MNQCPSLVEWEKKVSAETNKSVILRAFKAIHERDLPALMACIHDDVSWLLPYRQDRFPAGGMLDKSGVEQLMSNVFPGFTQWEFIVTGITAEDDRVALEATSSGVGPGGAIYKNIYHFAFELQDGLIYSAKEFFDPFEVLAFQEQWPREANDA